MSTILGIDEAGRGAVIGPLVVGGVLIDKEKEQELKNIEVKDSKLLTPKKREELEGKIKLIAKDFVLIKISAKEIDESRAKGTNLNRIEAEKMAQIIKLTKADHAYVDAPQVSTEKFKNILLNLIKNKTSEPTDKISRPYEARSDSGSSGHQSTRAKGLVDARPKFHTEITSENKADVKYPVVAAASILAKVERDREIELLKKKVGVNFGVGYPHDERTINFLKSLLEKGNYPDFVRKSWITAIEIKNKKAQRQIISF